MSEVGTNIKTLREGFGLTQQQLADFLETHRTQVAMYEIGSRKPPLAILTKLSDLFAVDLADILVGEVAVPPWGVGLKQVGPIALPVLRELASFFRIVRNYQRMDRLEKSVSAPLLNH